MILICTELAGHLPFCLEHVRAVIDLRVVILSRREYVLDSIQYVP